MYTKSHIISLHTYLTSDNTRRVSVWQIEPITVVQNVRINPIPGLLVATTPTSTSVQNATDNIVTDALDQTAHGNVQDAVAVHSMKSEQFTQKGEDHAKPRKSTT